MLSCKDCSKISNNNSAKSSNNSKSANIPPNKRIPWTHPQPSYNLATFLTSQECQPRPKPDPKIRSKKAKPSQRRTNHRKSLPIQDPLPLAAANRKQCRILTRLRRARNTVAWFSPQMKSSKATLKRVAIMFAREARLIARDNPSLSCKTAQKVQMHLVLSRVVGTVRRINRSSDTVTQWQNDFSLSLQSLTAI